MFKKLCLILALLLVLSGCATSSKKQEPVISSEVTSTSSQKTENIAPEKPQTIPEQSIIETKQVESQTTTEIELSTDEDSEQSISTDATPLEVHFIDVGQADSILIKAPGETMLIDAGNNDDGQNIVSYLKDQGISKIDILVGTHPYEDHIGGLEDVINSFDIGRIYMHRVVHTTQTSEDVLLAIQNKGLKIDEPIAGMTFDLGPAKYTILAPNKASYSNLNNYSIVIKLQYGQTSFLFVGDAEEISEREMLNRNYDLSADVLKIGHHGSNNSTSNKFLATVSPKYAVISVGKGNSYGHPHKETMNKLKNANIIIYRTDECGTIIATSDGNDITFNCEPGSYNAGSLGPDSENTVTPTSGASSQNDRIVYWTSNGKSYHYTKSCSTLSRSKTILDGPLSQCPKPDPCDRCVR